MITATKEEYEEVNMHFVLHDFADLCIAKGYDYMMSELAKVLDEKVDRLEPVLRYMQRYSLLS